MVKRKAKDKVSEFIQLLFEKIRDTPAVDFPEVALNLYLMYVSVVRFNSISMAWYGPLALKLINAPDQGEGAAIDIGPTGVSVQLPNAQQCGIAMLAILGLLSGINNLPSSWMNGDYSPFDPSGIIKSKAEEAATQYVTPTGQRFSSFEEFIQFGRKGIQ